MPIFEYICQQCNHQFEAIVMSKQKAACPKCESKRLSQQLSSFAVEAKSRALRLLPAAHAEAVATLVVRALAA
jgi:putative FmdB family regulatory protein